VLNRRLVSLLAAVSVAGLAATGCAEQSAAIRVDDATVSRRDFEDQLDYVYEHDEFRDLLFPGVTQDQLRADDDPPGTYRQDYVGALAGVQVQFLVVDRLLDDHGIDISDDHREAVVAELDQLPGGTDAVPDGMREQYIDGFAGFETLRDELAEDELDAALQEVIDGSTIEVSPRYGSWDSDQFTVVPPPGPAGAPGAAAEATGAPTG
jgi:hypothetical protein